MVFFSTDTNSYSIFTPARVKKQNHSTDHLNARILSSPGSLLRFTLPVLSLLASPCTNKLFLCSLAARLDPGGLRALRSEKKKMDVAEECAHALERFPVPFACCQPAARQTLPTPLPSSSTHWVMRLKAKRSNSKNKGNRFGVWRPHII